MKKANAVFVIGLVIGAVIVIQAQTEPPKNLAGVEFPCTYNKPSGSGLVNPERVKGVRVEG